VCCYRANKRERLAPPTLIHKQLGFVIFRFFLLFFFLLEKHPAKRRRGRGKSSPNNSPIFRGAISFPRSDSLALSPPGFAARALSLSLCCANNGFLSTRLDVYVSAAQKIIFPYLTLLSALAPPSFRIIEGKILSSFSSRSLLVVIRSLLSFCLSGRFFMCHHPPLLFFV
jgi:hypothetical protein